MSEFIKEMVSKYRNGEKINWHNSGMLEGLSGSNREILSNIFDHALKYLSDKLNDASDDDLSDNITDSYLFPMLRRIFSGLIEEGRSQVDPKYCIYVIDINKIYVQYEKAFDKMMSGLELLENIDGEAEAIAIICNDIIYGIRANVRKDPEYIKTLEKQYNRDNKIDNLID